MSLLLAQPVTILRAFFPIFLFDPNALRIFLALSALTIRTNGIASLLVKISASLRSLLSRFRAFILPLLASSYVVRVIGATQGVTPAIIVLSSLLSPRLQPFGRFVQSL
jgi:hypothetical protein